MFLGPIVRNYNFYNNGVPYTWHMESQKTLQIHRPLPFGLFVKKVGNKIELLDGCFRNLFNTTWTNKHIDSHWKLFGTSFFSLGWIHKTTHDTKIRVLYLGRTRWYIVVRDMLIGITFVKINTKSSLVHKASSFVALAYLCINIPT